MLNGTLLETDGIPHYCWIAATSKPCCLDRKRALAKTNEASGAVLFEHSDLVPAESTWTYATANFKKTILRRIMYSLGIATFKPPDVEKVNAQIVADGQAINTHHFIMEAKRISSVATYYLDDGNFHELVVITVIMDIFDEKLLYDCLGNPWASDAEATVHVVTLFCHQETSTISDCCERLRLLLDNWTGSATRTPRMLLDLVRAPTKSARLRSWSRAQVLKVDFVVQRG